MKTLFIVNPISGGRNKSFVPEVIAQHFDKNSFEIVNTDYIGHATELTIEGKKAGFMNFVAVGGDGTVNEVAKELIGTDYNLGILPLGSGNGLARHNHIPLQIDKALEAIKKQETKRIDTCKLNDYAFINMSGVGFDAHIGKLFAESKGRGLQTYISTTINEFMQYKAQDYTLKINGTKFDKNAFLISFANSSQYGNNAFIAPHADMEDGLVDVCIMKPFPPIGILDLGFKLFTKTIDQSQYVETIRANEVIVERDETGEIHVDGEPHETGKEIIIKVVPKSLNLIISRN
ncbi:MAG: YegS/Rv2252/BmrU family lipid kinase [Bacteroidota bacterium]|nr:YegS/Rv2252/BmrU family lipid kinase [Bacteroidota bacterium]